MKSFFASPIQERRYCLSGFPPLASTGTLRNYLSRNKIKYNYSYGIMHIASFPASYIQQFLSNRLPLVFQRKEKHPNYQARLIQMFNPQLLSPAVHQLQPRHSLLSPLRLPPLPLPNKPPRPSAPVRLSPRTLTSRAVNHPATVAL